MSAFFDEVEKILKENWKPILVCVGIFFLWKTGHLYDAIGAIFPFAGTAWLAWATFKMWVHYIQQDFISGIDWVLLEIIPPRDIPRSPKAMELFLINGLYHLSNKGGVEEFWQGAVHFWHSLEIVSIEGTVHFFIRTPSRLKSLVETQLYAQYPQAQIKVVEDYTLAVDHVSEHSAWNLWGCEFKLSRPEIYPIKTYVDFGLDKDPKEELKIDPITPVIEFFSSIGKGEQLWLQIVVKPPKKVYKINEHLVGRTVKGKFDWVEAGKIQIEKDLAPYINVRVQDDENRYGIEIRPPKSLDNMLAAAGNKTSKLGFETGIRTCYVAKKESFNQNTRRSLRLIFRQYGRPDINEFQRFNNTQADAFSAGLLSQWFMASPKTVRRLADRFLHEYRERAFWFLPLRHSAFAGLPWPISPFIFPNYFHHKTYMLNVEELATIWHFPGLILKVPTLERIESKEGAPPTNLPM